MNKAKLKRLARKGWKVTTAAEFLGLTPEEEKYIELRVTLAEAIKNRRLARGMTQNQLAKLIRSGQSRVAKIEAADMSVSVDLLLQTLFRLGESPRILVGSRSARASKKTAGRALARSRR